MESQLHRFARFVDDAALAALDEELSVFPKPGLVSYIDEGAHSDMNANTFVQSIQALRGYFFDQAVLGAECSSFEILRRRGVRAEEGMLRATKGVNTHRGAIFTLGLLAAAAGLLHNQGIPLQMQKLSQVIHAAWGPSIVLASGIDQESNGRRAVRAYQGECARAEASNGLPTLRDHVFPVLTPELPDSRVDAFFSSLAMLHDTNLLHRGGLAGLSWAQSTARAFMAAGGTRTWDWRIRATLIHAEFCERRLSPGGSADQLAAACFVLRLQNKL